ncbi:hypothetical protein, partial [Vibrio cholerae]|uniref:hypothetical protein n=1 Tax=Vibrio cholerae TaxID=666 RepID=UPI001F23210C
MSTSEKDALKGNTNYIMRNDLCPPPKFKTYPEIVMIGDSFGVLSSMPPHVTMVHDVSLCYMYKIEKIGD